MKNNYNYDYNYQLYKNILVGQYFYYENKVFIVTDRIQASNHLLNTAIDLATGLTWELDANDEVIRINPKITT